MVKKTSAATVQSGIPIPVRERRYIYNGSVVPGHTGFAIRSNNRGVRRKVSTFNIILLLFGLGGAIVFYINNIITINRLASEIGQLEAEYGKMNAVRESLRAEIMRKSALDHISAIAQDEIGLRQDLQQPEYFTIDRARLAEMQQAVEEPQK
jgi:cell division protein FtsB